MMLAHPSEIYLRKLAAGTNIASRKTLFKLEPFLWKGGLQELSGEGEFNWPHDGHFAGAVRSFNLSLLTEFHRLPASEGKIENLNLAVNWSDGPAKFAIDLSVAALRQGVPLTAEGSLRGDGRQVFLDKLAVSSQTQPVLTAHGILPLTITPAKPEKWLNFDVEQPVQLEAVTQPNSLFWDEVALSTGLVLVEPNLTLNVAGAWPKLRGNVEMNVQQIKLPTFTRRDAAKSVQPGAWKLERVRLSADLAPEMVHLKESKFLLEGQPVTITAELPLEETFWPALREGKAPVDWTRGTARLQMNNAQLGAFAPLVPKFFSREGRLTLDLALLPGANLDGELVLSEASTAPLGTLGAIREINLKLKFQQR